MFPHDLAKRLHYLGYGLHGLGLSVALAIAGLGYALVLRPTQWQLAALRAHEEQLQQLLSEADRLHTEHDQLARTIAHLQEKVAAARRRVPQEPSEAEFLSEVSGAAGQAGVKIQDYRPGIARAMEHCWQLEIRLACAGSYRSLCQFLARLAALPRLSRVVQMEMTAGKEPNQYPATLSLVVFFNLHDSSAPAPSGEKKQKPG